MQVPIAISFHVYITLKFFLFLFFLDLSKASSNNTSCRIAWYVVVILLVAGIIIGIPFCNILTCSCRKFGSRKPQSCHEPRACEVDSTYHKLDLTKMNREDNYQSLRVDVAINNVTK